MRPRLLLFSIVACMACSEHAAAPAAPVDPVSSCALTSCAGPASPPPDLTAYLGLALDAMQHNSINRTRIDWSLLRADVHARTANAATFEDMHVGIVYALGKLGDKHSYLAAPDAAYLFGRTPALQMRTPLAVGSIVDSKLAWISIPSEFSGGDTAHAFSDQVQEVVQQLDRGNPCGWLVDLRAILGGDMWPALAGLSPIIGDGILGAYVFGDNSRASWYAMGASVGLISGNESVQRASTSAAYRLHRSLPPVAVLLSSSVSGAGEAIAAAFSGRAFTRSFGQTTSGLPTVDQAFPLTDGWTMYVTVAADADRQGRVFWPNAIAPDEAQSNALTYPQSNDDAAVAARKWLLTQTSCQ